MPYSTTDHAGNLAQLGRDVRHYRNGSEQFCAFAFDLDQLRRLEPAVTSRYDKEDCLTTDGTWLASFWSTSKPQHTERAVLAVFDQWYSDYQSTYGAPNTLYIYSFLIPCLRDGGHGHCSDAIASQLLTLKKRGIDLTVYMGWSNDDRDLDMAQAIKTSVMDLEDDLLDVHIRKVSIA